MPKRASRKLYWRIIVNGGGTHDRELHALGLRPSPENASQYQALYPVSAAPILRGLIDRLTGMGLHGQARKASKPRGRKSRKKRQTEQPTVPPTAPSPQITAVLLQKKERLERETEARRQELRSQNQKRGVREAHLNARTAVLRAKGEM